MVAVGLFYAESTVIILSLSINIELRIDLVVSRSSLPPRCVPVKRRPIRRFSTTLQSHVAPPATAKWLFQDWPVPWKPHSVTHWCALFDAGVAMALP